MRVAAVRAEAAEVVVVAEVAAGEAEEVLARRSLLDVVSAMQSFDDSRSL